MALVTKGLEKACENSQAIREGVNTYQGHITYPAVADSQNKVWKDLSSVM